MSLYTGMNMEMLGKYVNQQHEARYQTQTTEQEGFEFDIKTLCSLCFCCSSWRWNSLEMTDAASICICSWRYFMVFSYVHFCISDLHYIKNNVSIGPFGDSKGKKMKSLLWGLKNHFKGPVKLESLKLYRLKIKVYAAL